MSVVFQKWFEKELKARDIDCGFKEYLAVIIKEEDSTCLFDAICAVSSAPDNAEFCEEIYRRYCDKDDEYYPQEDQLDDVAFLNESVNFRDEEEVAEPCLTENDDDEEMADGIDWTQLACELEDQLEQDSPGTIFSIDAIFNALYICQRGVRPASECLRKALSSALTARPCRHMLTGRCMRKDCIFTHSLGDIPCRYWLTTGCSAPSCPFLHQLPLGFEQEFISSANASSGVSRSTVIGNTGVDLQSTELFPALPVKPSTLATPNTTTVYSNQMQSNQFAGGRGKLVKTNIGAGFMPSSKEVRRAGATTVREDFSSSIPMPSGWVASGTAVGAKYRALREEARSLAIARNKLLQEATIAYMGGSRETAKNLSRAGQEMNDRMKRCHEEAARNIFSSSNMPSGLSRGELDLHGLHVAEAWDCVEAHLPVFRARRLPHALVITGTGHHTNGPQTGQSRLLPAMKELCGQYNCKYQVVTDSNGYQGAIKITL